MRKLRVLTWPVHGNYLFYLSQIPHTVYLPVKSSREGFYGGKGGGFDWPENLAEVDADKVRELELDCIIFQHKDNYFHHQYEILSERQRELPKIYLEHDPPRGHPTDTEHYVSDPEVILVHVTHFNRLMWDNRNLKTFVVRHGVVADTEAVYTGEIESGIAVVNNLKSRGRRLGADLFEKIRREVPVELAGMDARSLGGIGEIGHRELNSFMGKYRFFFNPIRYTSLGLAVCEAMTVGIPVVGFATTEMATTIRNGVTGYVDNSCENIIRFMKKLLKDREYARKLGRGAREYALENFNIQRFIRDWNSVLKTAVSKGSGRRKYV